MDAPTTAPLVESKDGLIVAYLLDGTGRGKALSWAEIKTWQPEQGLLWINLDFSNAAAHDWVQNHSGLDPVVTAQLLAEHSSARCALTASGVLLNLRAFNVNPYSELEDSVSIRLWTDSHRIVSLQRYHLAAIDAIVDSIKEGLGPRTAGGFMSDLAAEILEKSNTLITALEERVDDLQDLIETASPQDTRRKLSITRRKIVTMRRFLLPTRDALIRLQTDKIPWLSDLERAHVREVSDRTNRYVEDLDAARDRATIVQEELVSRTSEQISNKIYVLSIVSVIFMPLSFLVGLLGINVGGIPGAHSDWGFAGVCAIATAIAVFEWRILKRNFWV